MSGILGLGNAIGTTADMAGRLRAVLPTGWFPQSPPAPLSNATPVLDGLLSGLGTAWSLCFDLLDLTALQTRIATATGGFLDLIAVDFFAQALMRESNEADAAFRARILGNLLVKRGTRLAVIDRVAYLTGCVPVLIEPSRGADCGGYGSSTAISTGRGGYGTPGLLYGSDMMEFQYLLMAILPAPFAPGLSTSRRSPATYLDADANIVMAPAMILRPLYASGTLDGALIEGRSFNLITDSRNWTSLTDAAAWIAQPATEALFPSDPVLVLTVDADNRLAGPAVIVAAGGKPACGSVWILIPAGSDVTEAQMSLVDLAGNGSVTVSADMRSTGVWQRLEASLTATSAAGRTLQMTVGATASPMHSGTLMTQCWQIEPGSVATSYIPTSGSLGVRDADLVVTGSIQPVAYAPTSAALLATVAATQPIATIGWTAIIPAIVTG
nr:hypothetical protein [uncultured Lichenicoccus sp.]